jgi:uncharacterized protein
MAFMKTSIEFLPQHKQQELHVLVDIIKEKYNIEMIILFGSHARGNWVEEINENGFYKYQSDFDIFIVSETKQMADKIEGDSQLKSRIDHIIKTPVTIIAHDIDFFNRRLRKGQFFFSDIKREGVCLYDTRRFELAIERELSTKEYKHLAQEDFDYWFNRANEFLLDFKNASERSSYNQAAFMLHQTTERLYNTLLLVLTRYKPNTHDLEKLSKCVASIEPTLLAIFPQGTEEEKRRFELLRKAYIDARYNRNYVITSEELTWLAERVKILKMMTETICKKKIDGFV